MGRRANYRLRRRRVADDLPGCRRGHGEPEGGLEVWLLEHGEHATAVRHLELAVQVDLAVDRVDETVQAFTGVGVFGIRDNGQNFVGSEVVEVGGYDVGDGRVELQLVAV